ncbi:MAG: caspase family protein [Elusimicrobia bacterium]|nr:caspase family protein [Elusimicrobiota bacterium]
MAILDFWRHGGAALLAAALVPAAPVSAERTRGMRVVYKAPAQGAQGLWGEVTLYEHSYAVVIGIQRYQEPLRPLPVAVRDARNVGAALKKQGFEVITLIDAEADKEKISGLLGDEMPKRTTKEDRVLVYFAGHGVTEGEGDTAEGFLMPFGGSPEKKVATGVSMSDVVKWFGRYKSKHVMFVADACYSGLALNTRASPLSPAAQDYLKQVTEKPVRLALVAGGKGEEANELDGQGLFSSSSSKAWAERRTRTATASSRATSWPSTCARTWRRPLQGGWARGRTRRWGAGERASSCSSTRAGRGRPRPQSNMVRVLKAQGKYGARLVRHGWECLDVGAGLVA